MVNFRLLSENDFKFGTSAEAQTLRCIYGTDGYQKYSNKINSIIEEDKKQKKSSNPLAQTNSARISYLEQALQNAVNANRKARNALRSFIGHLSGMIKISSNQQADLSQKQIAYGKTDMNEDLLRSSLMEAYHSQGMHYNA